MVLVSATKQKWKLKNSKRTINIIIPGRQLTSQILTNYLVKVKLICVSDKWKVHIIPHAWNCLMSPLALRKSLGLPWWRSGWETACQCRGHGFELWSGKIPHAAEQLGPWATTTEPECLEPVLCNKRGRDSERPVHRDEEWSPLTATRESPHTETKTQHSQK